MDKADKERLRAIRQEMVDLLEEASDILRQNDRIIYNHVKHTWIGNLDVALGEGNFVDRHSETFAKTLKSLGIPICLDEDIEEDEEEDEVGDDEDLE